MTIAKFLDCSINVLTEREYNAVASSFSDIDAETPRVINHEYGCWLNVWDAESYVDREAELEATHPNVVALLRYARANGCWWINLDQDAGEIDDLPNFDW